MISNYSIDKLHLYILNVGMCRHNGDWNWKNVCSPFSRIYYVTEGTAQVVMPQGVFTLRPGHLYFIPAFTLHSDICTSHFVHYYIHLYEDQQNESGILDEYEYPFEVKAHDTDLALIKRLAEMNSILSIPKSDPGSYDNHQTLISNYKANLKRPFPSKVESRGITLIMMSRFLEQAKIKNEAKDNRIQQALTYIRKHISCQIEIEELAKKAYMSKGHFIRTFKEETGDTPNMYITRKIVEKAELLLVTTDLAIKQIADMLGYDDTSYFIRRFKKYSGMTPLEYRLKNS